MLLRYLQQPDLFSVLTISNSSPLFPSDVTLIKCSFDIIFASGDVKLSVMVRSILNARNLSVGLYCTLVYRTVEQHCTVLSCTVLWNSTVTIVYRTVEQHCTVLYCTVLWNSTVLYCTVEQHCTVLYCGTALYSTVHLIYSVRH